MDIVFRDASESDAAALRRVLGTEPTEEQFALAGGDERRARAFRELVNERLTARDALLRTTVAERQSGVVGLIQYGAEAGDGLTAALVFGIARIFGLGVPAFLRRNRLRARVAIAAPVGAFHIAEVHVAAEHRGGGIGGALIAEAERAARRAGAGTMSLTTATNNPARRLYERCGFAVAETRTDPAYEALTGVSGRVLMVKAISPPASPSRRAAGA